MYKIKIEGDFSSAHNLRGYRGKCEDLHGHNWKVEIVVAGKTLDKIGMLMDFRILKEKLYAVLEKMDHKYLNNLAYFKKVNPTSENIAKFIYDALKKQIPQLHCVTVWESDKASATYVK